MLRSKCSLFLCLAAVAVSSGYGLSSVAWADNGAAHQAAQAWPIALGASGGNILDRSSLYCCSGTLGALVEDATGRQYILSNNHVLARFNQAVPGEDVNHPGQIDQACGQDGVIADFSTFVPIQTRQGRNFPLNFVDAAIAEVRSGAVSSDGALLDVGLNSGKSVAAFLNQAVQKSGRTTGHTTGKVIALDVTVDVGYSEECGSSATKTARFSDQIRIGNSAFSAGGDSGSLILEHGTADAETGLPRAVGLLFAGNSTSTLANPIDLVLSSLNVSLVGGAGSPAEPEPSGSIAGVVTDAETGGTIMGASVSTDTGQSTTTNFSGEYALNDVPAGSRSVNAEASGYTPESQSVSVVQDATTKLDFML
ncbi:MAG: carboxypeptidase regulatory-like domain-containing protein, partial [Candidatus Hydrogenedentales bacterium]